MRRRPAQPPPLDRDRFVQASPPLDEDMYGELVPSTIALLISHLEVVGPSTDELFGGDPQIRDINDILDELRAGGRGVDLHALTRGDHRLAAAALAAYCRQLPDPLMPSPEAEQLFAALDVPDFAFRIAGIRDIISTFPEANQAVLHRVVYFLSKLGSTSSGNPLPQLAQLWAAMLLPAGPAHSRTRERRIKEFRLVALLLQQCSCIFEGSLEAHELPELALPSHLAAEAAEAEAASRQWVRIKASLLRDRAGQFKISLLEDASGIYLNKIEPTDVCDDRERLQVRDYLVSISRRSVDEMSLAQVKDTIKHAKSFLEVEVRRYAPAQADEHQKRAEEVSAAQARTLAAVGHHRAGRPPRGWPATAAPSGGGPRSACCAWCLHREYALDVPDLLSSRPLSCRNADSGRRCSCVATKSRWPSSSHRRAGQRADARRPPPSLHPLPHPPPARAHRPHRAAQGPLRLRERLAL